MTITQAETGKGDDDYALLQSGLSRAKYKVEAHLWSLDFGDGPINTSDLVTANTGNDFDAISVNDIIIRAVYNTETTGVIISTFDGDTWAEQTLDQPPDNGLPSISLTYDSVAHNVYLYMTSLGGIYLSLSGDYGATWSDWILSEAVSVPINASAFRDFLVAAAAPGEVYWTMYDTVLKTIKVNYSKTTSGTTIALQTSDLYLASEARSLAAILVPTEDDAARAFVFMSCDVPGQTSAMYVNNAVVKYIYRSGGIIAFEHTHGTFSDHIAVDLLDQENNYHFRENVKVNKLGDQFFLTHSSGDGTAAHPFVRYKFHTSKDGKYWSKGLILHGVDAIGHSSVKLVQAGDFTYAVSRRTTYQSPSTLLVGNSTVHVDLTADLMDYSIDQQDVTQTQIKLNNAGGQYDSYANPKHTWALIHYWGFDTLDGPMLQQTGIHQVDSWQPFQGINDDSNEYENSMTISARDRMGWMMDMVQSEDSQYWQAQLASADSYRDLTQTAYGGLQHTATQSGSWKTQNDTLLLCTNNTDSVAFSTFADAMWNGSQEIGFRLSKANNDEYAGLCFRGIDQDNTWYYVYNQRLDKLVLLQRRGGVISLAAESSTKSWATTSLTTYHFLKVVFRYATVYCYYSLDGITWTFDTSYIMPGASSITSEYDMVTIRPLERGFVGVIGRGYSTIEGWEPDPGNTVDATPQDDNNPGSGVDPMIEDAYTPNTLFYLQIDGTTTMNYHDAGLDEDVAVDITPDSGLISAVCGENGALMMIDDPFVKPRKLILGINGILICDDVKADTVVWRIAYHNALPFGGAFGGAEGGTVVDGTVYTWGHISASRKRRNFFAWLAYEGIPGGDRKDLYIYHTHDLFRTVKKTLIFEDVTVGGQNICIGPHNTVGRGDVWVNSGRNIDPLANGIWHSSDWCESWHDIYNTVSTDDFDGIPIIWGPVACPQLLPDGSPNLSHANVTAYWNSTGGVHGFNVGTTAYSISGLADLPGPTVPTGQSVNAAWLDGTRIGLLMKAEADGHLDEEGHLIGAYDVTGIRFPVIGTSTAFTIGVTEDDTATILFNGLNGWPTNKQWFVIFGNEVRVLTGLGPTNNHAGYDFDFATHGPVVTALPDIMELPTDDASSFNYDDYPPFNDLTDDGWGDLAYPPEQCVTFIRNYVNDAAGPQTVEDAFKVYSSFAGIHDYKFLTTFDWTKSVELDWALKDDGVTFSQTDDDLSVIIASGATSTVPSGAFNTVYEVPHSFLLRGYMDTTADRGFFLNGRVNDVSAFTHCHYFAGFDSDNFPYLLKYNETSTDYDLMYKLPVAVPTSGLVEVAVREMTFTADKDDFWLVFSIWVNHHLYFTWSEWIKQPPEFPYYIGFGGTATETVTVTNPNVPQLTDFVEWNSLDPGEYPMDALERAIDGRYTRMFMRFDGSLYAWKPVAVESAFTLDNDIIESFSRTTDLRQVATHVRMVGAYQQAEFVRDDLGFHRYKEMQNPYLMTERDCYSEAILSIHRQEELADQVTFQAPFRPTMEIGDRITLPAGDYIVDEIHVDFTPTEGVANVNARKYVYGA